MRQALLLVQTKGKPDDRHVGAFSEMSAKLKVLSAPDTHATLYELVRRKHVHIAASAVAAVPTEPVADEPKPWQSKKGK